ncbi:MAG TPA: hypothetical protein VE133_02255 [Candidatus Sulfotelmatobacter sp.]|nr:hypothetical protein [Candidatus Sulfotelmatobacter sp.]
MPDPKKTVMTNRLPLTGATAPTKLNPLRTGMPAMDSIHKVMQLKPKPGGPVYQIIRTTETDSYDTAPPIVNMTKMLRTKGPVPSAALAAAAKAKPKGDNFTGTDRKAAKLSKGQGKLENFKDLKDLIASLTPESKMINHKPKITTGATSGRVKEEQRNVSVSAFLYAAKAENDNDRHLIVGRDANLAPEIYMTMELSGLPPKNAATFAEISATRAAFKKFFAGKDPGATYDFYHPPIPIKIEGGLFFDTTHATGGRPGPQSLKSRMPVIWEVHPLTSIKLG